jgi:hypothetical protein
MDALETIARLDDGYFVENLNEVLQEVAEAVLVKAARTGASGVKGRVTVTFDVVHVTGGDPTVLVLPVFDKKVPKREAGGMQFFLYQGEFHTRDPRQQELNVRVVETPVGQPRTVPEQEPAPAREVTNDEPRLR